jgi:O-antigen ligase
MEIILLYLSAFLRPIFFIDLAESTGLQTTELFNWFAIALLILLAAAMFSNVALRKEFRVSIVDLLIVAFCIWCTTGYFLYPENSNGRELIKLLFPLCTYIVAKTVLRSTEQYTKMLKWMILGFAIPVFASAGLIASGGGIESLNYWTKLLRYEGVYSTSHSLSHNMTFVIMLLFIYARLKLSGDEGAKTWELTKKQVVLLGSIGAAALYCIAMSRVRTTIVGLAVFLLYYLFIYHRRLLVVVIIPLCAVVAVALGAWLYENLFFDFAKVQSGEWAAGEAGSGRPLIWAKNLQIFSDLSIDRQLAGLGVGNKVTSGEGVEDSHNDYLDTLMETGIIGLSLYVALQLAILVAILRMPLSIRHAFIGIFVAVALMNFASNSYITRSGLAQMYFLVMAYVEIRRVKQKARVAMPGQDARKRHIAWRDMIR